MTRSVVHWRKIILAANRGEMAERCDLGLGGTD